MARQRSSSVPFAILFAALVVYASLHPFEGWRWPPGRSLDEVLVLPWPRWHTRFDDWSNLLGYAPLGALVFAAIVRSGGRAAVALAGGVLLPALLSYALEVTQQFVPPRSPSLRDWVLNAAGASLGAVAAAVLQRAGAFTRWQRLRERWFVTDSGGAIVLLALWPAALLFPAPVPLGVGRVLGALRAGAAAAVEGTPWAARVEALLAADIGGAAVLTPLQEGAAIALGLLAPALLALVVTRAGWRRAAAVAGITALAVGATTLSTLLNFGPEHALTWLTPVTLPALAAGALLALLLSLAGPRLLAAIGLVVLTALVALVAQSEADPYYAASLQRWEQGRFVRFHGLAQWVGWIWPYAAIVWLVTRLSRRD